MRGSSSVVFLLATLAVLSSASTVPADTFQDDFSDPGVSPYWSPLVVGTGPSMVETGGVDGKLQLTIPTTATGVNLAVGYFSSCSLIGDFTVEATYELPAIPTNASRNRSISVVPISLGGQFLKGIGRAYDPAIGEVYWGVKENPVLFHPTTDTSGKLRFNRQGNRAYTEHFTGGQWVSLDTGTPYPTEEVRVAFWMVENPSPLPAELMIGTFDDIIITGTFNCPFQGYCGDLVMDPGETCDDGDEDGDDGCCACVLNPAPAGDVSDYWQLNTSCADDVLRTVQEVFVTQPAAGSNAAVIEATATCGSIITGGQSTPLTTCAFDPHAAEFCNGRFSFIPTIQELTFPVLPTATEQCPTLARIVLDGSSYQGVIAPDGSVAGTMAPSSVSMYNDGAASPCISIGGAFASCSFSMRRNSATPTEPTVEPLPGVRLSFDQLTQIVRVLVAPETIAAANLPADFIVVDGTFYDIRTAGGTFPASAVHVCFDYAQVPNAEELRIGHASEDDFEYQVLEVTLDTVNQRVCTVVNDFSQFAVLAYSNCGDGEVQYGEECDDGNLVDDDCCANDCTANHQECDDDGDICTEDICVTGICTHLIPSGACDQATSLRSSLTIKSSAAPSKNKVTWKWLSSDGFDLGGLGADDGSHDLGLCVYDNDEIVFSARVPEFGGCQGATCWDVDVEKGKVKYRSSDSLPDGIGKLQINSIDTETKTLGKIKVSGKGAALVLVDGGAPGLALPVRARLVSSESNTCWEGTFSIPGNVKKNDGESFKAKSD